MEVNNTAHTSVVVLQQHHYNRLLHKNISYKNV